MALAGLLGLLLSDVRILSPGGCPDPAIVHARLAELLGALPAGSMTAELSVRDETLTVALRERRGDREIAIGNRSLPASLPCLQLASMAAVVLAGMLDELAPQPAAPPTRLVLTSHLPPDQEVLPPRGEGIELGLGLLALMAFPNEAEAIGVRGSVAWQLPGSPWGLQLAALGETSRSLTVADQSIDWQRWALALGPTWRLPLAQGKMLFEVQLSGLLALLSLDGQALSDGKNFLRADPGIEVGLRFAFPLAHLTELTPWLGLWQETWFQRHPIEFSGEVSQEVPWLEGQAGLGLSLNP